MIDFNAIKKIVVSGLKESLNIPVIRSNQTAKLPSYPYLSFTITSPILSNNGTWGVYDDGIDRKPFGQVWSLTVQSDDDTEALSLCQMAYMWLSHDGLTDLSDQGIVVRNLTDISNRDNLITIEYEFRKGFDVTFSFMAEAKNQTEKTSYIETAKLTRT